MEGAIERDDAVEPILDVQMEEEEQVRGSVERSGNDRGEESAHYTDAFDGRIRIFEYTST